jgi:hypothetical protein
MRIFLSYSHQQKAEAAQLTDRLHVEGHRAFLDQDHLDKGEGYDRRIREEIEACDLFLFLISPASVRPGSYALTEIELARKRWPSAAGRVLPVMAESTPEDDIPSYLRAVGILTPTGDMVAEVLAEVASRAPRQRGRRLVLVIGLAAPAVLLLAALTTRVRSWREPAQRPPARTASQSPPPDPAAGSADRRKPEQVQLALRSPKAGSRSHRDPTRSNTPAPRERPREITDHTSGEGESTLPATPSASELARYFPRTRICRPTVEEHPLSSGELWLVCRCPVSAQAETRSNSLRLRPDEWRRRRWTHVARAVPGWWSCP